LELIAALGAAQGVLLLVLIAARFRGSHNVPLALLLLTFSIRVGTIPMWSPEGLAAARWLLPVAGAAPLLFGPLVWWCVRELVREELRPPRRTWLHALPWAVETAALAVYIGSLSPIGYEQLVHDLFVPPAPWWMPVRHVVKGLHGTAYAIASAAIAFGSQSRAPHVTAPRRLWARLVVALPLVCMLSFAVVAAEPTAHCAETHGAISPFSLPAAAMMLTIYAFAGLVLTAPDVLVLHAPRNGVGTATRIADPEIEAIADRVRRSLDQGTYLDSDLTITRLAKALKLHPNRLSLAINRAFGCNFAHLIHQYRLDYFLERVEAGDLKRFTILRLAFEAGFSSKTTFHRVFHERFGMPPSAYLRSRLDGSSGTEPQAEHRKPDNRTG